MTFLRVAFQEQNAEAKTQTDGILLAEYTREILVFKRKKLSFFQTARTRVLREKSRICLIFVPQKHALNELREVRAERLFPQKEITETTLPERWVHVNRYVSKFTSEQPYYYAEFQIENFFGYDFIPRKNSFIADVAEANTADSLEILYRNLPELLNET